MEILRTSEISPLKVYAMVAANGVQKMSSEVDGSVLSVANYVLRKEANKKTGADMEILTVQDEDGELYATNSPTFIGAFFDFVDFLQSNDIPEIGNLNIVVVHGVSNSGRSFITCNPFL